MAVGSFKVGGVEMGHFSGNLRSTCISLVQLLREVLTPTLDDIKPIRQAVCGVCGQEGSSWCTCRTVGLSSSGTEISKVVSVRIPLEFVDILLPPVVLDLSGLGLTLSL